MKKFLTFFSISLVVLIFGLILGRNLIARAAVSAGIKTMTGVGLGIAKLDIGLFKQYVSVQGVKLRNPKGFAEPVMADIPELYVAYDLGAFLKKKVHLQELRLNVKEIAVIKDKQGKVNLNSLTALMPKKSGPAAAGPAPQLRIDLLKFSVGRIVYTDYSSGRPSTKTVNLNINQTASNITDPKQLVGLVLSSALKNANLTSLLEVNLDTLIRGTVVQAGKGAGAAVEKAVKQLPGTLDNSKDTLKSAGEDLKKLIGM